MKPGRDLDALVAEKVMGHTIHEMFVGSQRCIMGIISKESSSTNPMIRYIEQTSPLPPYSTDIASAFKVVEKLTGKFGDYQLSLREPGDEYHDCQFQQGKNFFRSIGITAPHAICLAALKAVGVQL